MACSRGAASCVADATAVKPGCGGGAVSVQPRCSAPRGQRATIAPEHSTPPRRRGSRDRPNDRCGSRSRDPAGAPRSRDQPAGAGSRRRDARHVDQPDRARPCPRPDAPADLDDARRRRAQALRPRQPGWLPHSGRGPRRPARASPRPDASITSMGNGGASAYPGRPARLGRHGSGPRSGSSASKPRHGRAIRRRSGAGWHSSSGTAVSTRCCSCCSTRGTTGP